MEIIETERLRLRPFDEFDLDAFYNYAKNPQVGPNAGWKPHESKEESRAILKDFMEKDEVWAITDKLSGQLMGSIGLHDDPKRENDQARMLGYVLAEPYWGKGIATEAAEAVMQYAFESLALALLSVNCYPFNQRSKRVIEKCGFHYEGTLRMASKLYNGEIYDNVCYGMTKDDYNLR